jgi:hypothetical protein
VIWLFIRRTIDWEDEALFRAQLRDKLVPMVDLWDASFTIPYHRFRARVKAIGYACNEQVQGARITEDWNAIPDGALVLPCDDDDWFRSDVATVLAERIAAHPGASTYAWTASFVQRPMNRGHRLYIARRALLPFTWERWKVSTNNYALFKADATLPFADSHGKASEAIEDGRLVRHKFRERLSVMNRTLASSTQLGSGSWRPLPPELLMRKYERYRTLYHRPPHGLAWAAPQVAQMRDLMAELELRPDRPR